VSAPNGAPVAGAVAEVLSPFTATVLCSAEAGRTMCDIFGGRGAYHVQVTAAGYQSVQRQVQVRERAEECGCSTLLTQELDVVLPSE
jgi:hypothetical protein